LETAAATKVQPETNPSTALSSWSALLLAAWFGLIGGYLDIGAILLNRDFFHATLYYEQSRHFWWTVPLSSLSILLVAALIVVAIKQVRPRFISPRTTAWLFGTLAFWGPLLRAPFYGIASLLLACGLARGMRRLVVRPNARIRRFVPISLLVLVAGLGATAFSSLRQQALAESQALAKLPPPSPGAKNVLLIVMDTVRAESLGMYGYARDTTPHLVRWAKRGITFDMAFSPAPYTFPSHASFLTGQWPSTLYAYWRPTLDPAYPTLAGFLAARGYLTAGFAANTHWCTYESGMDRGFIHYEDYPLTARSILGSTVPGRWLLSNLRTPRDYHSVKWIRAQSRDANRVNGAFLDWLTREQYVHRPFFAFLNYLDAHEPFLPPPQGTKPSFGLRPRTSAEFRMLLNYWDRDKSTLTERDVQLARDAYDDCIAALDEQVGLLLAEVDKRGLLQNTLVVITSDHGEQFGEHGVFNHGFSLYAHEVRVPLLLLSPEAPHGQRVSKPVSLRDLAATVIDLCEINTGVRLPGQSWAECWRPADDKPADSAPRAISEVDIPLTIGPERGRGSNQRGFTMSLVAEGLHYVISTNGNEELYDLAADPAELRNLKNAPNRQSALRRFRAELLRALAERRGTTGAALDYHERLRLLLQTQDSNTSK
jgi:arylsulfatase A-like enzyme